MKNKMCTWLGKKRVGETKISWLKRKKKRQTNLLGVVGIRPCLRERVPLVVLCIRVRTRVAQRGRLQRDGRDLQLGRRPPAEQARRARAVRAQARRRAHRHMALAVTLALATPVPSPTSRAAAVPAPAAVLALVVVVLRVEVEVRHVRGRRERAQARRVRARREALRDPAQALCLPARAAIRTPTSTGAVLARRGPTRARARARARSAAPAPAPAAAVDVRAAKVMHVDDDGGVEADAERLGRLRAAAGPAHLVEGCGGHGDAVRAQVPARVRAHGERLVAQLQRALEGWIATHLHRRMK